MKIPKNFVQKLNGAIFNENGFEFVIEAHNDCVWIFGNNSEDFKNCILLMYDWNKSLFNVRICELGKGTVGYDAETECEIFNDDIQTLEKFVNNLRCITFFHFDKIKK